MAGVDIDVEGAFTHGDPEAVLDLLAIRSLRMRHNEDDVSVGTVPVFPSETDMEEFVRDFAIDDSISTCFADLPSSCDANVVTSNTVLSASRPEKKLIGWTTEPARRHGEQQQQPPPPPPESNSVPTQAKVHSKSRGFLASLLGRGSRGRRAENKKKSVGHSSNNVTVTSLKDPNLPPSGFPSAEVAATASMSRRDFAARGHVSLAPGVQTRGLGTGSAVGDLRYSRNGESAAVVNSHSGGGLGSGSKYNSGVDALTITESSVHGEATRRHKGAPASSAAAGYVASLTRDIESGKHTIPPASNDLNLAVTGTVPNPRDDTEQFTTAAEQQQLPHEAAPMSRMSSKEHPDNAGTELDFLRGKAKHKEPEAKTSAKPPPVPSTARRKVWEGWGDGVDAFIDFERDPNLEVPLDSHLSAQLDFERDPNLEVPLDPHLSSQLGFEREPNIEAPLLSTPSAQLGFERHPNAEGPSSESHLSAQLDVEHDTNPEGTFASPRRSSQPDFEHGLNLEVPLLDSHVSQRLDSERRPGECGPLQDSDPIYEFLMKHQVPETCTSVAPTSELASLPISTSRKPQSRAADAERVTQSSRDEAALERSPASSDAVTPHPLKCAGSEARVSASTQTLEVSRPSSEADWKARVVHCLQAAISQLSTLSACSACDGTVSRTMDDLQRALMEVKGEGQSPGRLGHSSAPVASSSVRRGSENHADSSGVTLAITDLSVDSTPSQTRRETDEVNADPGVSSPVDRASSDMEEEREGGGAEDDVNSPPPPHHHHQSHRHHHRHHGEFVIITEDAPEHQTRMEDDRHDETSLPPRDGSSQSELPPQQPCAGPRESVETFMTSSISASHPDSDSDSDSVSTVTSETTTVRTTRQRRNRSPAAAPDFPEADVGDGLPPQRSSLSNEHSNKEGAGGVKTSKMETLDSGSSPTGSQSLQSGNRSDTSVSVTLTPSEAGKKSESLSDLQSRPRTGGAGGWHYAGGADGDCESFLTSTWSEMTSVSSVGDVTTSADESSYYSGDDDDDDDEDDEDDEDDPETMVRLGIPDEDQDDNELRHQRLQRHLAAVLRQSTAPAVTMETVVAATGERLNSQERQYVNQGTLYPFSASDDLAPPSDIQATPLPALGVEPGGRGDWARIGPGSPVKALGRSREARPQAIVSRKGGATPRLFSPDRQVSLVAARQMTSDEFREGYDRSCDVAKVKRSQLDGDIPWDLLQFSDTDDDAGSVKAWYDVTSEEESGAHAYSTDTDSSVTVSDW